MKFVIGNENKEINTFLTVLGMIGNFNSFVTLIIEENRIYSQGMDSSHCCFYEFSVPKEFFTEFHNNSQLKVISFEKPTEIIKCLNKFGKKSKYLVFEHNDNSDKLNITLCDDETDKKLKKFVIDLVDIDQEYVQVTDLGYQITINSTKNIRDVLDEHMGLGDDMLKFTTFESDDKIWMCCKSVKWDYETTNEIESFDIHDDCEITEQSYSKRMLLPYYICDPNLFNTTYKIANEKPILITHTHTIVNNLEIVLKIFVAPKITEIDD
jgi:DNA polymerase III sliding clamp (beta) subunit (PCNA family)